MNLRPVPAREPAKERTEYEARLRCKRDIDGHADDDADRQAQHGSKRDGGSNVHMRECMFAARAWRLWPVCCSSVPS